MRLLELFQESIDHKLQYNKTLNPKIWDGDKLKLEPKLGLKRIAKKFIEFLKIEPASVTDVILTGSICNFNWSKLSDIDLHIVVDYDVVCDECAQFDVADCMNAKKSLWNDQHEITIYDHDVELYVQANTDPITGNAGVYSLKTDEWLKEPEFENIKYDDKAINQKAETISYIIDELVDNKSNDMEALNRLKERIKKMRKSGLENGGEFSIENLTFKALRNNGYLDKMNAYMTTLEDNTLSID